MNEPAPTMVSMVSSCHRKGNFSKSNFLQNINYVAESMHLCNSQTARVFLCVLADANDNEAMVSER